MSRIPVCLNLVAISCAVLMGACARIVSDDPDSPYSLVPEGSLLDIRRTIEVPPGRTRVFFQAGRETANFNHYAPSCNIEVSELVYDAVQHVAPGLYRIERVQRHVEEIVQTRSVTLAAAGGRLADMGDGGGTIMIYDGYHLWLDGDDDNLMRLTCRGVFSEPVDSRPPSVNEIRAALGESMYLQLAQP